MSNQTKKALITGASSGIGKATAALMLEQGFEVCGIARSFIAESSSDSKSGSKPQAEASLIDQIGLDLSDLDQLASELNNNQSLNQDFDCLILNAGYGRFGGVEQFSHAQIRQLIDTNLVSNLFLIKHYLPSFKRSGAKDIVLIGSESAITGAKQGAIYCASKFAIRGLAQSLRADCANADVRVILVNPGPVDTGFFDELHFEPIAGEEYVLDEVTIAQAICNALAQPRNTVIEELNIQPIKRAFQKRKP